MIPELRNFTASEFPDSARHTHPTLLRRLDAFRDALAVPIHPSRHPDGWVRTKGSESSRHHIDHADAGDIFPEGDVLHAFLMAQKFFNGVGIYYDTNRSTYQPGAMLHVDLRPMPMIWCRADGRYIYPSNSYAERVDFWYLAAEYAQEGGHG